MLNKIKNSLLTQTSFLFVLSFLFIVILWIVFYIQQIHQHKEHTMARYFSAVSSLQPLLLQSIPIDNDNLKILEMQVYKKTIPKQHKIVTKKGNSSKGFSVIEFDNIKVIHIYNSISEIFVEDTKKNENMIIIHIVFLLLLISQILLFIRVRKSLNPLSLMQNKLHNLEDGDLTPLQLNSNYDEIKQMISSYNKSIGKIKYILETREMFNKIFMHEMKMPIAKGMFYLKQEPSKHTHDKFNILLNRLNNELDEFSVIESLIVYQNNIKPVTNSTHNILTLAIEKIGIEQKSNISIENCNTHEIKGDKELWILCFKNLIDNALKYASDKKLTIRCTKNSISFINKGDKLPVNLSQDLNNWKIDKNQRHKSSTGYGFGLFIIKNIITLNGYNLEYSYTDNNIELKIIR